jgi:hypothetical protein
VLSEGKFLRAHTSPDIYVWPKKIFKFIPLNDIQFSEEEDTSLHQLPHHEGVMFPCVALYEINYFSHL